MEAAARYKKQSTATVAASSRRPYHTGVKEPTCEDDPQQKSQSLQPRGCPRKGSVKQLARPGKKDPKVFSGAPLRDPSVLRNPMVGTPSLQPARTVLRAQPVSLCTLHSGASTYTSASQCSVFKSLKRRSPSKSGLRCVKYLSNCCT